MKYFPVIIGLFWCGSFGLQPVAGFAFQADVQESPQAQPRRRQKRAGTSKLKPKMKKSIPVAASAWGGSGIRLDIGQKNAKVEYACADGEIDGPIIMDGNGNFTANGVHIKQRAGPVRVDEVPNRQPVRYDGRISGKTMTIKITIMENKEVIGEFDLIRDASVRLHRCL